ncbi:hypothetical protein D3C72_1484870 [compost metagenome]
MGAVTAGLRSVQARATCEALKPDSSASACTCSAITRLRSVSMPLLRTIARLVPFSSPMGCKSRRLYLPLKIPPDSGDQGITPRPISCAIGISSRSTVRSSRLYSICRPISGDQPRNSARVCILAACQAGRSETARYSTLPARTRSSMARMISSTGVVKSQACRYSRSI